VVETETMAEELVRIDVDDVPELRHLAEEVRETGEPRVLRRDGEDLAVLMPVKLPRRTSARVRSVTRDDALFRLIGIGKSGIPGGVSDKKHEQLARAYRPR
jgi:hypothetical protein